MCDEGRSSRLGQERGTQEGYHVAEWVYPEGGVVCTLKGREKLRVPP